MNINTQRHRTQRGNLRQSGTTLSSYKAREEAQFQESLTRDMAYTLDSLTASRPQPSRIGETLGGTLAGGIYTGLITSLALPIMAGAGVSTDTALAVWGGLSATGALAGGIASATAPLGQRWYASRG